MLVSKNFNFTGDYSAGGGTAAVAQSNWNYATTSLSTDFTWDNPTQDGSTVM